MVISSDVLGVCVVCLGMKYEVANGLQDTNWNLIDWTTGSWLSCAEVTALSTAPLPVIWLV